MSKEKIPYIKYDSNLTLEGGKSGLRIYLPTVRGYINYNLIHTVRPDRNADIWRLAQAFRADGTSEEGEPITSLAAEWDMAVMLRERCDFIGGYAHGDEIMYASSLEIDGVAIEPCSLCEPRAFKKMLFTVDSMGYDPDNNKEKVLLHRKEYTVTAEGVRLRQRVEWLGDYELSSSYLAMMPPLKALTDSYITDTQSEPQKIECPVTVDGAREAIVFGKDSGYSFKMATSEYPIYPEGNELSISDNKTVFYNKMYFIVCKSGRVCKGDVWNSTTEYSISAE